MERLIAITFVTAIACAGVNRAGAAASVDNTAIILNHMNHINRMELDMATVAKDRWNVEGVRTLAYAVHADHKTFQKNLEALAKKLEIELNEGDAAMADKKQAMIKELKDVKISEFDRVFIKAMVASHRDYILQLTAAKKKAAGPTKELLDKMLPVLKQHQRTAKQLAKEIK